MPIDTSIYNNVWKPDPMQGVDLRQKYLGLQNTALQNQLMQIHQQQAQAQNQLLQAQVGLGKHYAGAMGPNGLDTNKLLSLVTNDPTTAVMAPQAIDIGMKLNEPVSLQDESGRPYAVPRQEFQRGLSHTNQAQIDAMHERFDAYDRGIEIALQDPTPSGVIRAVTDPEVSKHLAPDERVAIVNGMPQQAEAVLPWLTEHKAKVTAARQQLPGRSEPFYTGPAPGTIEAANTTAKGSADALNNLREATGGSAARIYQLEQALHGLENATTGPGTADINRIKSFLAAQDPGVLTKFGIIDPQRIASYDEANKYLTQYATGVAGSMGQGTDAKLAAAMTGNANTHISNLAAKDVVKAAIGLEKMQQAQMAEFDASRLGPQDYNKFRSEWNKNVDPRAFIMPQLSPEQRSKMIEGLSKEERAKFANSLRLAMRNGFLTLPEQ